MLSKRLISYMLLAKPQVASPSSEAKLDFQALFEAVSGCYVILKSTFPFTIVAVNNAYLRATMTQRQAIIGKSMFEVFPDNPSDLGATGVTNLQASLEHVSKNHISHTMPIQRYDMRSAGAVSKFEERYWIPINTPLISATGDVDYIIHRVEDVTEFMQLKHKKAEQDKLQHSLQTRTEKMQAEIFEHLKKIERQAKALQVSSERYQRLTSMLPVGVFHADSGGNYLYTSPYWQKVSGLQENEVIGKPWFSLVHPEDRSRVETAWHQCKDKENCQFEFRLLSPEKEARWMLTQLVSDIDIKEEDKVQGYIGSLTDITERIKAKEEERRRAEALAEIDRAKMLFFGNVSHELRTPLTLILGPLEDALADNEQKLPSRQHGRVMLIYHNALRLTKLVNSLLDFSRLEGGHLQGHYEAIELAEFTHDLINAFRPAIEKAGLKINVDMTSLEEPIYVDKDMWEKIVFNLLSNALKFTLQGAITITLKKQKEAIEFSVTDTGIGIPAPELPRLFERFHRIEGARGRSQEGAGIGLALVQELTKLHRGTVRVTSEVGKGSTFTVTIPRGKAHLPAQQIQTALHPPKQSRTLGSVFIEEALLWSPQTSEETARLEFKSALPVHIKQKGSRKEKILVVDDNAHIREYLRSILSPHWEICMAEDGEAAVEIAAKEKPDLIVSDVMMPKMDGFQLTRALRSKPETKALPIILLSSRVGEEALLESIEGEANDYLEKPFSSKELLARITLHLKLHSFFTELELKVAERTGELRQTIDQMKEIEKARLEAVQKAEETQRKRAQEAEANQKRLNDFIDTMCHELRNPLNGIYGSVSLQEANLVSLEKLLQTAEEKDISPTAKGKLEKHAAQEREFIQTIDRCARHQKTITDDVLNLSKLEAGKVVLNCENFDAEKVIADTIAMVETEIVRKNLQVYKKIAHQNMKINTDPNRLAQVLLNLLSNAVKFTPEKGEITISLRVLEEKTDTRLLQFRVKDTGVGLTPEEQAQLFNRFVQMGRHTYQEYGGSGLGLAISKNLVELMGGTIAVESEKWKGSKFTFTITGKPVLSEEKTVVKTAVVSSKLKTDVIPKVSAHILVVEDNLINQKLLVRLLTGEGYQCHVANNGKEAVEMFKHIPIDIILMDIEMPIMNGLAAAKTLRELERQRQLPSTPIPIIALSGNARQEKIDEALQVGMNDYLVKPYEKPKLLERIAHFMKDRGPISEMIATSPRQQTKFT